MRPHIPPPPRPHPHRGPAPHTALHQAPAPPTHAGPLRLGLPRPPPPPPLPPPGSLLDPRPRVPTPRCPRFPPALTKPPLPLADPDTGRRLPRLAPPPASYWPAPLRPPRPGRCRPSRRTTAPSPPRGKCPANPRARRQTPRPSMVREAGPCLTSPRGGGGSLQCSWSGVTGGGVVRPAARGRCGAGTEPGSGELEAALPEALFHPRKAGLEAALRGAGTRPVAFPAEPSHVGGNPRFGLRWKLFSRGQSQSLPLPRSDCLLPASEFSR